MRRLIVPGILIGLMTIAALFLVGTAYDLDTAVFWTVIGGAGAIMALVFAFLAIVTRGGSPDPQTPSPGEPIRSPWLRSILIMFVIAFVATVLVLLAPRPRIDGGQAQRTTDPPTPTVTPTTSPPTTPTVVPTTTSVPPVAKTSTTTTTPPAQPTSGRFTYPADAAPVTHTEIHPAGTVSNLAAGHLLLVMLYIPDYPRYFPGDDVVVEPNGTWTSTIYIGGPDNPAGPFTLFLLDLGPAGQQALADYWEQQRISGNVVGFDKLQFHSDVKSLDSVSITL